MAYKVWRQTQGGHKADKLRTHDGQMAGKVWRRGERDTRRTHLTQGGHMTDTWRTSFGGTAHTTRHKGDKVWRRGQAHPRRTQDGQTADTRQTHGRQGGIDAAKAESRDTRRTHGGQGLEAWPSTLTADNAGHMADKLRGRGQGILRPAFILLRKNPTVNYLGKKKEDNYFPPFFLKS